MRRQVVVSNEQERRNRNRGYRKLVVWADAIDYYGVTCQVFRPFPYDLKRIVSQQIAAVDSVHRNIAEGYCRRSIKEYLQFLNIALASLGESVSSIHCYHKANQISDQQCAELDSIAYKIENGLLKLVAALEKKRDQGSWNEKQIIRESNAACGDIDTSNHPPPPSSTHPIPQPSNPPLS